jgi:helix-turn-helix protein
VRLLSTSSDTFGPRLRALRVEKGLSLTSFARQLFYSKGHVSRVETGVQAPSAEFARRCDAALDAGGELASLVPAGPSESPAVMPEDSDEDGVWMMVMGADGTSTFGMVGRRGLLLGGAAMLTAGAAGRRPLRAGAGESAVDTAGNLLVYRRMLDAVRDLGQVEPPDRVLPIVVGQARALQTLARDARGQAALDLATLTARTAEYAGWMAQDAGDDDTAAWWIDRAVRVADAVGDRDTAAYALVRRALVTLYRGDGPATIDLARRAQADLGVGPRILGLAAQREAQGHALAGDHLRCMRALDLAAERLAAARAQASSGPAIGTAHVLDTITVVTGWCLYDLGRPAEAAAMLDEGVARISADAVRARTRFGVRQALAHAAAGELDHACALAASMITKVSGLGSATIRMDLSRLAASLRRWRTHPAVRELEPDFGAVLYRGG